MDSHHASNFKNCQTALHQALEKLERMRCEGYPFALFFPSSPPSPVFLFSRSPLKKEKRGKNLFF